MQKLARAIILSFCLLFVQSTMQAGEKVFTVKSPNGKLSVEVTVGEKINYSISHDGTQLLSKSPISMTLSDGKVFGQNPKGVKSKKRTEKEMITSPFYRVKSFETEYNELALTFSGKYGVTFRAYNEGAAYRFETTLKGEIEIVNEQADFNFDKDYTTYMAYSTGKTEPEAMAFQNLYTVAKLSEGDASNLSFLPVTIAYEGGKKMTITEADLEAYPGMFIRPQAGKTSFSGSFARLPLKTKISPYRCQEVVTDRANCIAKVKGSRTFPWRAFAVTEKDTEMPVNNLVYALAPANRIGDYSWVKPGKVAWDWWNDWGLTGVDFQSGINMETYKYYIDFASTNKLEYVVLDEGWYLPKSGDVMTVIPELNLPELVRYAKQKNVKLVLWAVLNSLDEKLEEACKQYAAMGIAGFKVDFLDRDDQKAVEMVYRAAQKTAEYKMFIDFHGMYKPTGLNRTYPNVINFEAVFGMEEVKWGKIANDMPAYDVTMPFIRMMAGPVDFTPGALRNATKRDFQAIYYNPMSMGTRCHQLAMYVVYDSPFTMLCDAPTAYEQEEECTQFIAAIPTVAEETKILSGEIGQYIISARMNKGTWYVGGLTNWTARDVEVDFSFLGNGSYTVTIMKDGVNANKNATDYKQETIKVTKETKIKIPMAPGGGFAMIVSPQ
ncbi:MAG: glycoside hydrolase family 97 protein [Bacteroidales bacterium]|jgi:alpha-glucosidase|nr:glycoside hydrolase family 97 protein [Bacteroidales bacterium]